MRGDSWDDAVDPKLTRALSDIVGSSAAAQRARRLVEKVTGFGEPVLLMGEAGTGKEQFARFLCSRGATPEGPFGPINCSVFTGAPDAEVDTLFGPSGLLYKAK